MLFRSGLHDTGGLPNRAADIGVGKAKPNPRSCGELPSTHGSFSINLRPVAGGVDLKLSEEARRVARKSLSNWRERTLAYFPLVRLGDPMFHVYFVKNGKVESVFEFTISEGKPSEGPHWDYSSSLKKRHLPQGSMSRISNKKLWLGSEVLGGNQQR